MTERLSGKEWVGLIRTVFAPDPGETLRILVDVPDEASGDHEEWRDRRRIAGEWLASLREIAPELGLREVSACFYPNVGSNNADLPGRAWRFAGDLPDLAGLDAATLERQASPIDLATVLSGTDILLALTEFSATAPLKLLGKSHRYRAATMPGFSRRMIPALRIDFGEVARRLEALKARLDEAEGADAIFAVRGGARHEVHFDLRHRAATVSSGILRARGTAGNLPSGETYIVPYEGERGEPSRTAGTLPVQLGGDVVLYRIEGNRAVEAAGSGAAVDDERRRLRDEPAYGNIAELGFGILRDFGVLPAGSILLDEKLGFHVAFGRSDHFGGATAASDFRDPKNVVHIDRIYIAECQDRVQAESVRLRYPGGRTEPLLEGGRYTAIG